MNFTKTIREYCLQNKGGIFDISREFEDHFSACNKKTFYKILNRLEEEGILIRKSQGIYTIVDDHNDRTGSGDRIIDWYTRDGHGVPSVVGVYGEKAYEFSENFITVCIPFNREGFRETTSKTTKKHPEIIRKEIITLLKSNPYLSRVDLAMAIGITEGSARHHLNKLKESGVIVHRGSDKGGYWEIIG